MKLRLRHLLKKLFRDVPIERKMMITIFGTAAAALLVCGVAIMIADAILFYGFLQRDLMTLAAIVADNSVAALAFDDPKSAAETLSALRARGHLDSACLYRLDGTTLAHFYREGEDLKCMAPPPPGIHSAKGRLTVTRQVMLERRSVGTLSIVYDLGEIRERSQLYGAAVLLVLLISSVVAVLLSSALSGMIASPILGLARAAATVSETRDYSIRIPKVSEDEVGQLVDGFNEMLSGIQSRDKELTEALRAQEEALGRLARSNADLRRSNDDLERFAFVASHDLQEPLRNVAVSSQLLVREYPGDSADRVKTLVDRIVGGTKRMRDLLTDLRGYTEIAAAANLPLSPVDLNVVFEEVCQNLRVAIEENGAEVTSDPLPTIAAAHHGHLVSLLQNLIGNAIKYRSQEPPRVHVSARQDDGQWLFSVTDNGIGIQPEYRRKIFVPFKRLHGSEVPGTGIGLAICQRVVERYGGRIWVESEPGKGSTFFFRLSAT